MTSSVEVVVVDGASPDNTEEVLRPFLNDARVRYFREQTNSGVDRDYDKAIQYARGDYCWMMTDDDLLLPGAIDCVLNACAGRPAIVVVNAAVRNLDLTDMLNPSLLNRSSDRTFAPEEFDQLFLETAKYLSFIGALVIRRDLWLGRDRERFWGSAFAHVGVVFQKPLDADAVVLGKPLIAIRYGNSMWSPRALEIWLANWPSLIMGLDSLPLHSRGAVAELAPIRFVRKLVMYRAIGALDRGQLVLAPIARLPLGHRILASLIASIPRSFATAVAALYCLTGGKPSKMTAYDLAHVPKPARISLWVAARLGVR
jgi:hypothetical protein